MEDYTLLEKSDVEFTEFKGSFLDTFFGFNYIIQRNKNACLVFGGKKKMPLGNPDMGLIWECVSPDNRILYYPSKFFKNFAKCKEKKGVRFIFVYLGIHSMMKCSEGMNWKAHANMLMYDQKTNTFYRFEPHGCRFQDTDYDAAQLDILLTDFLKKHFKADYQNPKQCCPQFGIQTIEQMRGKKLEGDPVGFCVAWTLWITEFRLKHPNMPFKDLQYEAIRRLDEDNRDMTKFIRNFSQELIEKRKQILEQLPDKIIQKITKGENFANLSKRELKLLNSLLQKEFTEMITKT